MKNRYRAVGSIMQIICDGFVGFKRLLNDSRSIAAVMILVVAAGCDLSRMAPQTGGAIPDPSDSRANVALRDLFAIPASQGRQYLSEASDALTVETISKVSIFLASGKTAEAFGVLDAADLQNTPVDDLLRGACLAADGNDAGALELIGPHNSSDSLILYTLGIIQHRQGKLQQASELFFQAASAFCLTDTDRYYRDMSLMYLALELGEQGRLRSSADAWELYDQSIQDRPITDVMVAQDIDHYARWGETLFELGDCSAAGSVLDMAFRLDKTNGNIPPMLIESLLVCGHFDHAREVALEMLSGPANKAACMELLIKLFSTTAEVDGPQKMLADLTRSGLMVDETVLLSLARSAWLLGDKEAAILMLSDNIEALQYPHLVAGSLFRWLLLEGRAQDALEAVCRTLTHNSDCSDQLTRLLDSAPKDIFTDELIDAFAAAGSAQPSPERLFIAALAAGRSGNADRAIEILEASCPLDGDNLFPPAVAALCQAKAAGGDIDIYAKYAARFEEFGQQWFARYLFGAQMAAANDAEKAVSLLEMSLQDRETYDATRIMLAELQFSNRMFGKALNTLAPAVSRFRQLDYAVTLSSFYDRASRYYAEQEDTRQASMAARRAEVVLQEVLAVDPAHPGALTSMMLRSGTSSNFIESSAIARRLYELGCRDAGFLYVKVLVQTRLGSAGLLPQMRYEQALSDIAEAMAVRGRTHQLVSLLAEMHARAGLHAEAAAEYVRMRQQDKFAGPDGYTFQAALQFMQAGMNDQALEQFDLIAGKLPNTDIKYLKFSLSPEAESVDALFPDGADTRFWRDICHDQLSRSGLLESDIDLVEIFKSKVQESDRDAYGSAIIASAENYPKFALKWFTSQTSAYWLKRYVETRHISNPLSEAKSRGMNMRERFKFSQEIYSCTPVDLAVLRMLKRGEVAEAIGYCVSVADEVQALGERDSVELADHIRAALLVSLKLSANKAIAEQLAREFVEKHPDSLVLLRESLNVLPPSGKLYNKCRKKALELSPLDSTLNNNLAYEWLNRGVNLDRCSDMLYRAMTYGAGTHIADSLGWLMYKRGWLPRARRQLEDAVNASDGDSSVMYDHLGDVYWRLGHKDRAIEMWRQAEALCQADVSTYSELLDEDSLVVGKRAASKIFAVESGREDVPVAPLGKGVE